MDIIDKTKIKYFLYARKSSEAEDKLAEDATVAPEGGGFTGITLAHNVSTKEEVNSVIEVAVKAGATLMKKPQDAFWGGYSGYFSDPDGYLWEVAYNPFTDLT